MFFSKRDRNDVKFLVSSKGKTIKIEITESNESVSDAYKDQLILYAKRIGANYKVSGRKVKIKLSDASVAKNIRQHLKKMLQWVVFNDYSLFLSLVK